MNNLVKSILNNLFGIGGFFHAVIAIVVLNGIIIGSLYFLLSNITNTSTEFILGIGFTLGGGAIIIGAATWEIGKSAWSSLESAIVKTKVLFS